MFITNLPEDADVEYDGAIFHVVGGQVVEEAASLRTSAASQEQEEPVLNTSVVADIQVEEPEAEELPAVEAAPAEEAKAEEVHEHDVVPAEEPEKQAEPVYNAEKVNDFVERCYRTILGREGSEDEIAGWATQITNGNKTPAQVIRGFLSSDEFKEKTMDNKTLVKILYRAYMNREADPEGLTMWTTKLDEGVALNYIIKEFERSPEFRSIVNGMKCILMR